MRPTYHDLAPGDFGDQLAPYDFVELKYDGLYAEFVGNSDGWSIHGRNGRLIRYGEEPCPDCYLRGEMIIDTEWAQGSYQYGSFIAWDCIYSGDRVPTDYIDGREMLIKALEQIEIDAWQAAAFISGDATGLTVSIEDAPELWRDLVLKDGHEGLVFRSADGKRFGRMKQIVTQDYVLTGFRERAGRVTALYGGLYWPSGRLETVCTVPVKSASEQVGLYRCAQLVSPGRRVVFEAKGNAILKSGALRHPRQAGKNGAVKFRPDKRAEECRL